MDAAVRDVRVAVIGSGFAGLGMAVALRERGETDFVVLERAGDVGGTWRDNHYPGAACDVQSNLYSISFAPNPDWPRSYSAQPEIQAYLQGVADRYDVRRHVPPTSSARSRTTKSVSPRLRRAMAMPRPAKPDPMIATRTSRTAVSTDCLPSC